MAAASEVDIARYAVACLDDDRTLNRHVTVLPPKNVISQNALIDLWEAKSKQSLVRRSLSAEDIEDQIDSASNPGELIPLQVSRMVWIHGAMGKRREGVLEATELYPDIEYQTISSFLDQLLG